VGIDGGCGVDFGGNTWQGLNWMGLVIVVMAEKGFVEVAASFEIIWRMYLGWQSPYVPWAPVSRG
jgi:hypothetical protein